MGAEPAGARVVRAERACAALCRCRESACVFCAGACFCNFRACSAFIFLSSEAALLHSMQSYGALQALLYFLVYVFFVYLVVYLSSVRRDIGSWCACCVPHSCARFRWIFAIRNVRSHPCRCSDCFVFCIFERAATRCFPGVPTGKRGFPFLELFSIHRIFHISIFLFLATICGSGVSPKGEAIY